LDDVGNRDIHRIGGASVENLRLKPAEQELDLPGISVLKCATPHQAVKQIRAALPRATRLHDAARTVASSTEELSLSAGFEIVPMPSRTLPNHYRITHPDGVAGFGDENLTRLAMAFIEIHEDQS
jgi:hypothetical protein